MSKYEDLFKRLKEAVSYLPIDDFVKVDLDEACYVDWDSIDAADFKDNAEKFAKAMIHIKCIQLDEDYYD